MDKATIDSYGGTSLTSDNRMQQKTARYDQGLSDKVATPSLPEQVSFDIRFSRCRPLLFHIARRVLNDERGVDEAVRNCFLSGSRADPGFTSEGAFRSWLLRVLIDEALLIRRRDQLNTAPGELVPVTGSHHTVTQNGRRGYKGNHKVLS
jgi:hypothetical protein